MDTWSLKESDLPTTETIPPSQGKSDSVRSLIYQLGKTMEKEVHVWWDIATLDFYVNNNIVPRGLRLFKRSTYKRHDQTLLKKWDQLLDKGSLLLMVFLINEKKKDLTQLDHEITELKASIRPLVESGDYIGLLEKIEKRVKDIEENIREVKRKKIMRDQADYRNQIQRNWKKDRRPFHNSPIKHRTEPRPQYHQSYRDALLSRKTPRKYSTNDWTYNRPPQNRQQRVTYNQHHQRYEHRKTEYEHRNTEYRDQGRYQHYPRQTSFVSRSGKSSDFKETSSPSPRILPPDHRKTNLENNQRHISSIHTENDFLEKRGRIPPKRFSVEDFMSPDVRKKRTLRDLEEEAELHEEQTQQKRRK
ncbi:PREDICTED: uncharacterized protein LOC108698306 isoform X2 [Pelobates cultripes]|uniref:PREDICTED: uncharacterized protein LOC108698306 isoform X2 n=2 Tax=Pelobates cultripes TaxID=61616 RepID=A0AAD1TR00_PELCU|nr:PREDICTED: uncharacterized protein LOC108698306 isoform X2 [Pelobates cultripes]